MENWITHIYLFLMIIKRVMGKDNKRLNTEQIDIFIVLTKLGFGKSFFVPAKYQQVKVSVNGPNFLSMPNG